MKRFSLFVLFCVLLVLVPDIAQAQCGGGLFGGGLFGGASRRSERRQSRRSSRVEARQSAAASYGAACAQAPSKQAPEKQAPYSMLPAPVREEVRIDYPAASVISLETFVSTQCPDIAWDKVPEGTQVLEIPHW